MRDDKQMSSDLFELLCGQAAAGRSIDLVAGGTHATFEQAKAMLILMNQRGVLSVYDDGYDDCEMVELRLLGCRLFNKPADQPQTPPPDDQPIW